jgi:hypothetical protein
LTRITPLTIYASKATPTALKVFLEQVQAGLMVPFPHTLPNKTNRLSEKSYVAQWSAIYKATVNEVATQMDHKPTLPVFIDFVKNLYRNCRNLRDIQFEGVQKWPIFFVRELRNKNAKEFVLRCIGACGTAEDFLERFKESTTAYEVMTKVIKGITPMISHEDIHHPDQEQAEAVQEQASAPAEEAEEEEEDEAEEEAEEEVAEEAEEESEEEDEEDEEEAEEEIEERLRKKRRRTTPRIKGSAQSARQKGLETLTLAKKYREFQRELHSKAIHPDIVPSPVGDQVIDLTIDDLQGMLDAMPTCFCEALIDPKLHDIFECPICHVLHHADCAKIDLKCVLNPDQVIDQIVANPLKAYLLSRNMLVCKICNEPFQSKDTKPFRCSACLFSFHDRCI